MLPLFPVVTAADVEVLDDVGRRLAAAGTTVHAAARRLTAACSSCGWRGRGAGAGLATTSDVAAALVDAADHLAAAAAATWTLRAQVAAELAALTALQHRVLAALHGLAVLPGTLAHLPGTITQEVGQELARGLLHVARLAQADGPCLRIPGLPGLPLLPVPPTGSAAWRELDRVLHGAGVMV